MYTVHESEIMAWLAAYEGERYHALLCDPPYHLTSITKRFGGTGAAPAKHGKDGAFARASRGFMGKQWDGGNIAFQPELWHGLATLLYPGAFGMAFASTRGYHRMACAIEDAGLIIHPMIAWVFSSGFPKATRIDTQIDKAAGATRETAGKHPNPGSTNARLAMGDGCQPSPNISLPETELAKTWAGHRYGLQALVPSLEPIVVFQRPYEGKPVDSIVETGAGALNIEAARIGNSGGGWSGNPSNGYSGGIESTGIPVDTGRWAKNFILAHSPDCGDTCTESCPVLRMDAQMGEFFFSADYVLERMEDSNPFVYAAKASTAEREAGLTDVPLQQLRTTYDKSVREMHGNDSGHERRNPHPTVKPLALTQYLASLLLPPDAYAPRRLLVPFAGSGSEMIGAMLAGWEHIGGIEMDAEYAAVARARLDFWRAHKPNLAGKKKPKATIKKSNPNQKTLI